MFNLGSKIYTTIGRRGEKPDVYPATIVSAPTVEKINGRNTRVADVISLQKTLAGEERLVLRLAHDLGFSFPGRTDQFEMLDGTPRQPLTVGELWAKQAQQSLDYLMSRPESVSQVDLSAVDVTEVPA